MYSSFSLIHSFCKERYTKMYGNLVYTLKGLWCSRGVPQNPVEIYKSSHLALEKGVRAGGGWDLRG